MTRWIAAALAVVALYLAGVPHNPPGFFLDEASIAYNAFTIASDGVDEHGARFPLFFRAFGEYKNPVYIYVLAAVFAVIGPSVLASRLLSALFGVAAVLVLGRLAWVQTRSPAVTTLTIGAAALTPGLFEISRLVFEVAAFPLAIALFLLAARRASEGTWSIAGLSATLALVTYTYTAGRILGPVLALLLALFVSRRTWRALAAVWLLYALALVPLFVWNAKTGGVLTSRKGVVVEDDRAVTFARNYATNLSPVGLLWSGDPNARHHVPRSGGPVLVATFLLALAAIVFGRRDRWVLFLLGGALVSVVPVAIAVDVGHALRLSGLFVFLLALSISALQRFIATRWVVTAVVLVGLMQAGAFFYAFHTRGALRLREFNAGIDALISDALDQPQRPIYMYAGGGVAGAYWFGALEGAGRTDFAVLQPHENPPPGAILLGGPKPRPDSVVIRRHGLFGIHRIEPE